MNRKQYLEYVEHFNNKRYDAVTSYFTPDITVEEATVSGIEELPQLREADLEHHLTNDKQPDESTPTSKAVPSRPVPRTKPKGGDKGKTELPEFGGKNDYQLNQAINLLKGLQILQGQN